MSQETEQVEIKDNDTSQIITLHGDEVSANLDFQNNEVIVGMSNEVYEELEEKIREHETGDNTQ